MGVEGIVAWVIWEHEAYPVWEIAAELELDTQQLELM